MNVFPIKNLDSPSTISYVNLPEEKMDEAIHDATEVLLDKPPAQFVEQMTSSAETQTFVSEISAFVHGSLGSAKMEYATLGPFVAM